MDNKQNEQGPPEKPDAEDWQLRHDTMVDSLGFLLFNDVMSDVDFVVGPQRVRMHAHKFVLAIRSTVFHAMFYGMLAHENEVKIPDIEPDAFRNLLRYLYTDQVKIEPYSLIPTLYAAKKYALPRLEKRCEELLGSSLNPGNAFFLLTQARIFDLPDLLALCLDVIDKQTPACLNAKCFLDIDYDTLEIVMRRDALWVKEIDIYEAVTSWSQAECERRDLAVISENQRTVLKDCTKLIRYPVMSNQEFAQGPAQNGLLTDKEKLDIFLHINSNPKPVCEFQDKRRHGIIIGSEVVCDRFGTYNSNTSDNWSPSRSRCPSGSRHRIIFQVNQNILVSGFGLYPPYSEPYENEADIELVHTATKTTMASSKARFLGNCYATTPVKVLFKEPVEVLAHTNYCAVATTSLTTFGGQCGKSEVTVECKYNQKVTFQFCDGKTDHSSTTVKRGQIPQILFYLRGY